MLNFLLAILVGCAQPTEFDYCLEYSEAECACDPERCGPNRCEILDMATVCDPQNAGFSASKCEAAHTMAASHPWECIADAMATCDDEARIHCYPEEQW